MTTSALPAAARRPASRDSARKCQEALRTIRLAIDGKGELFIMSKSDGMIRQVVGAADR
jgi:hypothetical protein